VQNRFSLISAGTEKSTVSVGQSGLLGKAQKRPDLVRQVFDNFRKEGARATLDKVMNKLESLKALGYSSSGVVMDSLDNQAAFKPGDRVACAGQDYASHAEVVCVPQNLVVKLPEAVSFEHAAFTTLGAIALQGVRQASPRLGEKVCVIGLGLLGQLTVQLLRANGCLVAGIDLSPDMARLASQSGAQLALTRESPELAQACANFTNGHGFDAVIITAAAPTNDPVELAGELLRKKGVVVVVGDVKMDLPRNPHYYRKELELKMSCSYGPGRYDHNYEEQGQDYPYAYVRWTEQRNMEAFLDIVASGAMKLDLLISHVFGIDKALEAYDLVLGKKHEPYVGILLQYPEGQETRRSKFTTAFNSLREVNVGFIGAGSFAQSYLLPFVRGMASLDTVVTRTGISSSGVAQKFQFNYASTSVEDILNNEKINTVFIATQHDTHARFVVDALNRGKHVFVEKPLALNFEQLDVVRQAYQNSSGLRLMVGYNRRFAPVCVSAKRHFANIGEPLVMNFRINAGFLPKSHWSQTSAGGGRVVGEMCHFIDLMQFFTGARPTSVHAASIQTRNETATPEDNLCATLTFDDGSVGSLVYVANSDSRLAKERLEILGGGMAYLIDDFRSGMLLKDGKTTKENSVGKGHKQEVEAFVEWVKGGPRPIELESLYLTSLATFKILESLSSRQAQAIAIPQDWNV